MTTRDQAIDFLGQLSPEEMSSVLEDVAKKWGVWPTIVGDRPVPLNWEEGIVTDFTVTLVAFTDKIRTMMAVRELTGMGLREAKEFLENSGPRILHRGMSRSDAEAVRDNFKTLGAVVRVTAAE